MGVGTGVATGARALAPILWANISYLQFRVKSNPADLHANLHTHKFTKLLSLNNFKIGPSHPLVKAFSTKIGVRGNFGLLRIISSLWWIHESFLCEILYFIDSWKYSPCWRLGCSDTVQTIVRSRAWVGLWSCEERASSRRRAVITLFESLILRSH